MSKQEIQYHFAGKGSRKRRGEFITQASGLPGKLAHVSRYLGGRFHVDLWAHVEVTYRLTAIKIGWNSCARFCCSKVNSKFRKLVFGSLFYSPALAGVEIWTLSDNQVGSLNIRVLFFARKLMRGDARLTFEGSDGQAEHHRAMSNAAVWRKMGLALAEIELHVRNLSGCKKWSDILRAMVISGLHCWARLTLKWSHRNCHGSSRLT